MKRAFFILISLMIFVPVVAGAAGCGQQTAEANQLVDEVNQIAGDVAPKLDQADKLLTQATDQLSQGKTDEEKASLTQAQGLIDDIVGDITTAKSKTEQAAALDISDTYRQYLQAKGRALDEALGLNQTSRDITVLLLADPTMQQSDTLTKLNILKTNGEAQSQRLKDAEDEANNIASAHADEIK